MVHTSTVTLMTMTMDVVMLMTRHVSLTTTITPCLMSHVMHVTNGCVVLGPGGSATGGTLMASDMMCGDVCVCGRWEGSFMCDDHDPI